MLVTIPDLKRWYLMAHVPRAIAIKGRPERMWLVEKYFLRSNHIQDLTHQCRWYHTKQNTKKQPKNATTKKHCRIDINPLKIDFWSIWWILSFAPTTGIPSSHLKYSMKLTYRWSSCYSRLRKCLVSLQHLSCILITRKHQDSVTKSAMHRAFK